MIKLKHERQAQISEYDSFIILLKLNYFMRIHMIFYNEFAREKKFTLLRSFLNIFKTDISVILIMYLLFESNCVAIII